eukprot:COSAG05_NODE_697_length_7869_cov_14.189937_6_plen_248_part_00
MPPLVAVAVVATLATGAVRTSRLQLNVSRVYESPLPGFRFLEGGAEGGMVLAWATAASTSGWDTAPTIDDGCADDIFDGAMVDSRPTILPWTLQDNWGHERAPTAVPTIVMENEVLEVTIVPTWGGKIHSIRHKATDTQLIYANEVHQPLNGGVRKAWSAGGIEWNWSPGMIGHSAFTEAPVHVASVPSPLGDALRIWEFDRFNNTVFQVDLLLANSSSAGIGAQNALWIHGKVSPRHSPLTTRRCS